MHFQNISTRRNFLKTSAAVAFGSAALLSGCGDLSNKYSSKSKSSVISKGDVVLFQGDSITDSGRTRGLTHSLGNGYVNFIAGQLTAQLPTYKLDILNRGISGNTVTDLDARWDADCIALKPDVLSILIGVNDIWHTIDGSYDGTIEKYETGYRALLNRTKDALPNVKLIICEPFVLRCGTVEKNISKWFPEFDDYRASAKKISDEFNAIFVPFQTMFDNATKDVEPEYWSKDGVHLTTAGAVLMANEWLKVVGI